MLKIVIDAKLIQKSKLLVQFDIYNISIQFEVVINNKSRVYAFNLPAFLK